MQSSNKQAFHSPMMSKVIDLDKYLSQVGTLPSKRIQHTKIKRLDEKMDTLFEYAMSELRGWDYRKRALEVLFKIQALNFRIHSLGGWSFRVACIIDAKCDTIMDELNKIESSNARTIKSKDEDGRV